VYVLRAERFGGIRQGRQELQEHGSSRLVEFLAR
jgi:hypothetical protein